MFRRKGWLVVVVIAAAVIILAGITIAASRPSTTNSASSADKVALGVFNESGPWEITNDDEYVAQIGAEPAIVSWRQSWAPSSESEFPESGAQEIYNEGQAQLVTWEPQDHSVNKYFKPA